MKTAFPGFAPEGLAFLRELKENNDREWFTPRKHIYEEQVRLPMIELVRAVHREMLRFAPPLQNERRGFLPELESREARRRRVLFFRLAR
jgi:uncharacterized protein (DUF2461 family)